VAKKWNVDVLVVAKNGHIQTSPALRYSRVS
jgi:hypothetical protein